MNKLAFFFGRGPMIFWYVAFYVATLLSVRLIFDVHKGTDVGLMVPAWLAYVGMTLCALILLIDIGLFYRGLRCELSLGPSLLRAIVWLLMSLVVFAALFYYSWTAEPRTAGIVFCCLWFPLHWYLLSLYTARTARRRQLQ